MRRQGCCFFGQPFSVTFRDSGGAGMGRELRDTSFEAERRQLTVMFCDLVGSSTLSEQLDPEDLREIIRAYQETCVAIIDRFGGYLARYVGDGVLVCFGYPESHEDDTERALRAAFGIIDAIPELNRSLNQYERIELAVRIGVANGLVVAGDIIGEKEREQHAIVGQTPNLAARLQGLAKPNSVVIASPIRDLLGEQFEYEDFGLHKFDGFSEPIAAWRVIRPVEGVTRFEATRRKRLVPLIGREEETELLLECWRRAKAGRGQSILLSGEAGIGKSRLAECFSERIANEPHVELRFQCHSYFKSSAFHPIIEQLERTAVHLPNEASEQKLAKLERLIARSGCNSDEVVQLFASLLSIPISSKYASLNLSPRQQKERTIVALTDYFLGLAAQQPVFALVEDMHWMDPSSRELFDLVWQRIRAARALLLVTTREQHIALSWSKAEHASAITLNRLDRDDSMAMVTHMTKGKPLPEMVLEEIVEKTDGVPLHVEELTKSILESGLLKEERGRYRLNLPVSLQGSLMARLDQLGPAKRIAQYASVIGREFSLRLLTEVSGLTGQGLRNELERLVQSDLIYQCGSMSDPTFLFKHALVQDAAYESLLHKERRDLHVRVARALQNSFPQLTETQPELFAHHYSQAGDIRTALVFCMSAGRRSIATCAFVEAISHLRKALGLLARMPASVDRDEQELDIQIAIGSAITATSGYGAQEAGEAFDQALRLCRKLDRPEKLFPILYGIGGFHLMRTELDKTQQIAEEIAEKAKSSADPTGTLLGCRLLGSTAFLRGDFHRASNYLNQALALYDIDRHPSMIAVNSEDYLTTGLAYLSLVNVVLGNLEDALDASYKSLAHARRLGHLYSVGYALSFCEFMHRLRGESAAVRKLTVELIELSREQGYPQFLAGARTLQGSAMVDEGEIKDGLDMIQNGVQEYASLGTSTYVPFGLSILANALGKAGMIDSAIGTVGQAIAMADKSGEQWYKAELVRQNGELILLRGGNSAEAEAYFQKALSIARSQDATFWELRAATSLAQLWRDTRNNDARALLEPIYGRFTQGFDTSSLSQAKELLWSLQQSCERLAK